MGAGSRDVSVKCAPFVTTRVTVHGSGELLMIVKLTLLLFPTDTAPNWIVPFATNVTGAPAVSAR
jgi:hypothetical protein